MNRFRLILASVLCLAPYLAHAAVTVQNLRQWRAPDHTRLVFDVSGPLEHRVFTLTHPDRVVIDLDNAELAGPLPALDFNGPLLAGVRTGRPNDDTLRVVLDLKTAVEPRTFVLGPAGDYGHRLVIDLIDRQAALAEEKTDAELQRKRNDKPKADRVEPKRPFVIAIDAGHGGEDPGAIGRRYRTREKDVTLAIARDLGRLVNADPSMRPVLIRNGDYYVGLRERYHRARKRHADLFISIHADAIPGRGQQASGASVYALSEKGATDAMAKIIADKENASDLVGGVDISDMDDMLAKVLLDLSQTKTIQDSLVFGGDLLSELKRVGPVHTSFVRQAGFVVLKAPDIPSVLVETGYISNPAEERKLRSSRYQRRIAKGIYRGIKRYLSHAPASRTLVRVDDRHTDTSQATQNF